MNDMAKVAAGRFLFYLRMRMEGLSPWSARHDWCKNTDTRQTRWGYAQDIKWSSRSRKMRSRKIRIPNQWKLRRKSEPTHLGRFAKKVILHGNLGI